jgi:hypothetical protein
MVKKAKGSPHGGTGHISSSGPDAGADTSVNGASTSSASSSSTTSKGAKVNAGSRRTKSTSTTGSIWVYLLTGAMIVAILGIVGMRLLASQQPHQPHPVDTSASSTAKATQGAKAGATDYDGYVALSMKNKWEHSNPIERLEYLARIYSQSYTVSTPTCARLVGANESAISLASSEKDKKFASFMAYVKQDFSFVINVLASTTNMQFDLTTLFLDCLEASKRLTFKVIKEIISKCGIGYLITSLTSRIISYRHHFAMCSELCRG